MRKASKLFAVTTLAFTLALPFTAYAGTWQQDSTGWKVQNDNGTCITNAWYQNTDGKWYYIGADGYMMVNATTPDGYQVGADGVWIQTQPQAQPSQESIPQEPVQTEPVIQETQQTNEAPMSLEEEAKMWEDLGLGGAPQGEVVREVHGDAEDAKGFDWN